VNGPAGVAARAAPAGRKSVFKRKPAPDLIRGGDRFASRKRVKSRIKNLARRFDSIETGL
jgi:hypothetical protein